MMSVGDSGSDLSVTCGHRVTIIEKNRRRHRDEAR